MSLPPSTIPSGFQRRSRTFWITSWLLVALYLVASGRAFIPGICATQRAMDAQCASASDGSSMRALRACCVLPRGESEESELPIAPGESGCALCKLVSSAAPLAATVYVPVPPNPEFLSPQIRPAQRSGTDLVGTFQTRAPPLSSHLI